MTDPVNHRAVLNAFQLLRQADPSAVVTGTKELLRTGDLVFALSLAPTVRHDEYSGFTLRTVNVRVGELDSTHLPFRELGVATGRKPDEKPLHRLDPYNVHLLTGGINTDKARRAVLQHLAVFTGDYIPQ